MDQGVLISFRQLKDKLASTSGSTAFAKLYILLCIGELLAPGNLDKVSLKYGAYLKGEFASIKTYNWSQHVLETALAGLSAWHVSRKVYPSGDINFLIMHLLDSLVIEKYNAVVKPTCGHWDDGKIGRVVKKLTQPDGSLTLTLKEESLIGQGLEVKEPSYLAIESDGEGEEELSVKKDDVDVPKSNPVAPAPKQRTVLPQADDPILLLTRKFPDKEQVSITRLLSVNCHFFFYC
ncbi:hypothetical protein LINGRAPRIM_LOCUS154 [Linum grandiflorum]